jgi:hypothetical protein
VVEHRAAEFWEAQVLSAEGGWLKLQRVDNQEPHRADAGDAYALDSSSRAPREVGAVAICGAGSQRWVACRIESRRQGQLAAIDPSGERMQLEPRRVLTPTRLTAENIEAAFEAAARLRAFERAAQRYSAPAVSKSWRPAAKERVLALSGQEWLTAFVHELEDDGVRVRWRANERISKVSWSEVAPEPPYRQHFAAGDFALLRPSLESEPWRVVRVTSTREPIRVELPSGEERQSRLADLVPLRGPG